MLNKARNGNNTTNRYQYAKIKKHARKDILWQLVCFQHWSRASIIQLYRETFKIWTDASGTKGIGGHYNFKHLFAADVPRRHRRKTYQLEGDVWDSAHSIFYGTNIGQTENSSCIVIIKGVVDAVNKKPIRGQQSDH